MKKRIFVLIASAVCFFGCKKPATQTGVPGKWAITSDYVQVSIAANPITSNIKISEHPWFQFNNDGTGSFMRDTSGKGTVVNFSYTLRQDTEYVNKPPVPVIFINVPAQVVSGANVQAYQSYYNIEQVNSQVLKVGELTFLGTTSREEFITMTRE